MKLASKLIGALALASLAVFICGCKNPPPPPLPRDEVPLQPMTLEIFQRIMRNESVLRVQYYLSEELVLERDKLLRRVDVTIDGEVIEYDFPSKETIRFRKELQGELIELLPMGDKGWILKVSFDERNESQTLSFLFDGTNSFCRLVYAEIPSGKTVIYGNSDRPFNVVNAILDPHLLIRYETHITSRPLSDFVRGRIVTPLGR
jgi:hypothetical protein